jgi:protein SCO1/2
MAVACTSARADDEREPRYTSAEAKPLSPEMRAIDVEEHRGQKLDPNLKFIDHEGREITAASWFDDKRPVLLTLNYYRCRVVCSVQLSGIADALSELDWTPGDTNFRVVTVSLDPNETQADTVHKREQILDSLGRGPDVDWQFLRADATTIAALAAQLGVSYAYDAEQDQFAHPAVAMFVAPDGMIAQYVYGLTYESRDIKFALIEAGLGKVGSPMEKLYLSCFTYDHTVGRYGPWAFGMMRIGASISAAALGLLIVVLWRRERRRRDTISSIRGGSTAEAVS